MTEESKKKVAQKDGTINPILAGIAGAVAGGVAVGAAVVLSDKDNRKKISEMLNTTKDEVLETVNAVKSDPAIGNVGHKAQKAVKDLQHDVAAKI